MAKIALFSFFSGAGFLDLGFEMTKHYEVVYVNEFHKPFNDIYKFARMQMEIPEPIYGHHVEDITTFLESNKIKQLKQKIRESKKNTITGIIGGPPCPDFSVAGKNRGKEGENGKLSGVYSKIICQTLPNFFLFENVKGLYRTAKHRTFFEHLKNELKKSGYILTEQLINSLEFGAPQDRERIILIGFHKSIIKKLSLKITNNDSLNLDWDKHKKYSKEQISKIEWPQTTEYIKDGELPCPKNILPELTVAHWWDKNDVENHPNANMYFKPRAGIIRFQSVDEGDDKKKCFKRIHRWRYSPTAAYGNNEVHIHPFKPRRISVSEALAIQSLPKEYVLPNTISLTDAFKSIGNGVPYLAAYGIAENIYDYITNK